LPEQPLRAARELWDQAAADFDQEPDHGLRDPGVRRAWTALLARLLPASPATILDIGCGTGSLSVVMAGLGHAVTGGDLSPAMIARARDKTAAAGQAILFQVMDAAQPSLAPGQFDVVVCRHLLWALPEPAAVLAVPGAHLHRYGKSPRPGRKVGHVTVTADDRAELDLRVGAVRAVLPADVG